jgi:hypothetical protein
VARDVQIRLPDGGAPQSYGVPNATEIIPLAINATFDGTGAAGSFVPTVEIISDGGVVIARVPCQTTVAAGGSAECTFAPFLRADSGGSMSGQQQLGVYHSDAVTVSGSSNVVVSWVYDAGDAVLDLSAPTLPTVTSSGVWFVVCNFQGSGTWVSGNGLEGDLSTQLPVLTRSLTTSLADNSAAVPRGTTAITAALTAGDQLRFALFNQTSFNRDVQMSSAYVMKLFSL